MPVRSKYSNMLKLPDVDYLSKLCGEKRHEQSTVYDDFFAGFGLGSGSFATLDENWPVCGGFGLPRILILLFAIGYFVTRNHYTPEISREFRKR